jgi:hypothetical protein
MHLRNLASALLASSTLLLGACSAAPDDGSADGASTGSAQSGAPESRSAEATFVLTATDDKGLVTAPSFFLKTGSRATLSLEVSDPDAKEVERQDDMGAATIDVATLTLLEITDLRTGEAKVLDTQTIAVRAIGAELSVTKPSAGVFDRHLRSGGAFAISVSRISGGESAFFKVIKLSVKASW